MKASRMCTSTSTVKHYTGPLSQEQSYYPFGLQMAGISDKALLKQTNPYKFNGGTELEEDGGLNYYNTFYRKYDPQTGRFTGVDMLAEKYPGLSPYHFGNNNPALFNDPTGALEGEAARRTAGGLIVGGSIYGGYDGGVTYIDGSDAEFGGSGGAGGGIGGGGGWGSAFESGDYAAFWAVVWGLTPNDGSSHSIVFNDNNNNSIYYSYENESQSAIFNAPEYHDTKSFTEGEWYKFIGTTEHLDIAGFMKSEESEYAPVETINEAASFAYETTGQTITEAQKLGNLYAKINSPIVNGGGTVNLIGKGLAAVGVGITIADGLTNENGWQSHHTADLGVDALVYAISEASGPVGWIVGGAWFLSNLVYEHYHGGRSITQDAFDPK